MLQGYAINTEVNIGKQILLRALLIYPPTTFRQTLFGSQFKNK